MDSTASVAPGVHRDLAADVERRSQPACRTRVLRAIAIVTLSSCATAEVRVRSSLAERLIEREWLIEEPADATTRDQTCAASLTIGRTTCVLHVATLHETPHCNAQGECVFLDGFERELGELLACGDAFTGCGGTLVCDCRPHSATTDERPK